MTRHFSPPAPEPTAVPAAILIDAARCWREARDSGQSVQPRLFRALDQHDCTMLAPVLDSLCLFYEAALGRSMSVGEALALSDDEHLLLGLVAGSKPRQYLNCRKARQARSTARSARQGSCWRSPSAGQPRNRHSKRRGQNVGPQPFRTATSRG